MFQGTDLSYLYFVICLCDHSWWGKRFFCCLTWLTSRLGKPLRNNLCKADQRLERIIKGSFCAMQISKQNAGCSVGGKMPDYWWNRKSPMHQTDGDAKASFWLAGQTLAGEDWALIGGDYLGVHTGRLALCVYINPSGNLGHWCFHRVVEVEAALRGPFWRQSVSRAANCVTAARRSARFGSVAVHTWTAGVNTLAGTRKSTEQESNSRLQWAITQKDHCTRQVIAFGFHNCTIVLGQEALVNYLPSLAISVAQLVGVGVGAWKASLERGCDSHSPWHTPAFIARSQLWRKYSSQ